MSDVIKHECGIALIRLRKPLAYYIEKYGTPTYAAKKLYLLMEKQKNRGQDGAGVANIKINQEPGYKYISRYRSVDPDPINSIFRKIDRKYTKAAKAGQDEFFNKCVLLDVWNLEEGEVCEYYKNAKLARNAWGIMQAAAATYPAEIGILS